MNRQKIDRLHLFLLVEEMLLEMNRREVMDCSEATLRCMKHIFKQLRIFLLRQEMKRIERLKDKGKISPKEAVHRKALLRKRWR